MARTIADYVDTILTATVDKTRAEALIAKARASLKDRLTDIAAEQGGSPTIKAKGRGAVRLDLESDWLPLVTDHDAFASHIAERRPGVAGVIRVPASSLEAALDALDAVGITDPDVSLDVPSIVRDDYLNDVQITAEDVPGGRVFTATHINPETGEATDVPGVQGTRTPARLVVTLDRDAKRAAVDEGVAQADTLDAPDDPEPAGWVEPPLPVWALNADSATDADTDAANAALIEAQHPTRPATIYDGYTVLELKRALRALDLPQTGRKPDLIDRLNAHDTRKATS
ncbi:SAP domain-containing protein [uncultured Arsenicicoccus sp.]|uniref:SAP domain-containing protein n=1 Tax=uncultured Arsenicicoccus sp. TaxID=491339 RepID=UPI0025952813|nr:SAP domain-containing protein [uncultured Arsenicicoccus sp.]